ncbi:(2Fe-2S)-binding protein [Aestuariivirga sp.]|uniref:(2Fe-2S)-binding protein n=1 Tax=Aestuariivirga sp. TaxID=2650926 RepID=UPI003BABD2B0
MIEFIVNGRLAQVDVEPDTPLLWVLREQLNLTGTKYGCGIGACGACTILFEGDALRSCSLPVGDAAGMNIVTIEGLEDNGRFSKVQQAWIDHQVPQCGYCQSGMVMATTALLKRNPQPSDAEIDAEVSNICRCGTFQQVRQAIHAIRNA